MAKQEVTVIHVNELYMPETDAFSKAFNECSDLYRRSKDMSLSLEERQKAANDWFERRQCLELGIG